MNLLCTMKKIFGGLIALLLLQSCDNEIDVNADYKDLTVMYGVLDPASDTNYVRIQRGYLGDAAASASFGISDSLYYDSAEIDVFIREYDNPSATTFDREAKLIWDDSKTLDTGTFTGEGHHLYRVPSNFNIQRDKEYEVIVRRLDGTEASARTGVVGRIRILRPLEPFSIRIFNGQIQFIADQETTQPNPEATVKMTAYQPVLYFHYKEVNLSTDEQSFHTVTIRLPLQETRFDQTEIIYNGSQLYAALAGEIEPDPSKNILRFFQNMDLEITGVSEDMMTYIELNKPATGVNQNRPQFEQVVNGTGILTSRTSVRREQIDLQETIESRMLENSLICDLNFAILKLNGSDTCYCINNQEVCF